MYLYTGSVGVSPYWQPRCLLFACVACAHSCNSASLYAESHTKLPCSEAHISAILFCRMFYISITDIVTTGFTNINRLKMAIGKKKLLRLFDILSLLFLMYFLLYSFELLLYSACELLFIVHVNCLSNCFTTQSVHGNRFCIYRVLFRWMTSKHMYSIEFAGAPPGSPEELIMGFRDGKSTYCRIFELLCL